ncbi:hypothetical protein [Bacillus cereus]|uniref:hypothetical protein n=1 Tax=Bacillus cereus TaxID=1396 RepID=UPI000BED7E68|nr:hypothetical protein [Bacillus cereus]PEF63697.1 hypothetical protein CON35_17455 [Bacillus cereus]
MEKVSQHVLDILSAGISEHTQDIVLMMMAYEDELDTVSIEEIDAAYKKLETAIVFYRSHAMRPERILIEELYKRLKMQLHRIKGKKPEKEANVFSSNMSSFPKGITAHVEEGEHMYYVFDHDVLGRIGRLFVRYEGVNDLYIEAEMAKEDRGNIVKERMLQRVVNIFEKDFLGIHS